MTRNKKPTLSLNGLAPTAFQTTRILVHRRKANAVLAVHSIPDFITLLCLR